MDDTKPTYEELKKRLSRAEGLIAALKDDGQDTDGEQGATNQSAAFPGELEFIEAYIESEENFRNSIDGCPLGIRVITADGDLFYANQAILDICGYKTIEELKAVPTEQLYTPESHAAHLERKAKRVKGEYVPSEYQISIRRPGGEIRTLEVLRREITWGGERQFMAMYEDITKRIEAEKALKNRESFLNNIIEKTPSPLWVSDEKGAIIRMNQALRDLLKIKDEETIGKYNVLQDIQVREQGYLPLVKSVFEEGKTVSFTLNYQTAKEPNLNMSVPAEVVLEIVMSAVRNEEGKVIHAICQEKDITAQRKLEASLRYHANLVERVSDAIVSSDVNMKILSWNEAAEEMYGWLESEVIGRSVLDITKLELLHETQQEIHESLLKTGHWRGEAIHQRRNGEKFNVLISVSRMNDQNGIESGAVSIFKDVTEQKKAEEALLASEKRYRDSLDNMMEGCQIIDRNWRYTYINDASARLSHLSKEKLLGREITEVFPGVEKTDMYAAYKKCMDQRIPIRMENESYLDNGTHIWLDISIHPIPEGIFILSLDITDRKQNEERITHLNLALRSIRNVNQLITREKNRERLIQGVCNSMVVSGSFENAWIVLLDDARQPVTWAQSNNSNFGNVKLFGKYAELPRCAQKALKQKRVVVMDNLYEQCQGCPALGTRRSIGSMAVRLESEGNIYGVLCASMPVDLLSDEDEKSLFHEVAEDIAFALRDIELGSTHELLQQEQIRAAKLESIGTLAGGIAHDFNNLLTGIMGNIGLAKASLPEGSGVYEVLDEAEKAAMRSRDLTLQLLTFARGGKPIKKVMNITGVIKDSATFALRGSAVRLELSLPEDLWLVEADEGQIGQVIHNLVINADEAMSQSGTLTITARNFTIERAGTSPVPPGNYVLIDISDTGTGISPENLQKIFEPYFTTKRKGSGLGLTSAYSIIKSHGGSLLAESSLNRGSVFHVYLPASRKTAKGEKKLAEKTSNQAGGKVLIMDDDEIIRKMLKNMLNLAGYEVESSADGAEALEKYKKAMDARDTFNAVIMDLTVPGGMGGKEAITKLLEIDPAASVIVSSGYATDPIMSEYKKYGFSAVIAKPYSIRQLQETINGLISGKKK